MYIFRLQEFLNQVLLPINPGGPVLPSIESTYTIEQATQDETADEACSFLPTVFNFLNSTYSTSYNYTEYYEINPNTGSGGDSIIMIESGIMDSPYLKEYILANCIH
jgi:hypothetical protein